MKQDLREAFRFLTANPDLRRSSFDPGTRDRRHSTFLASSMACCSDRWRTRNRIDWRGWGEQYGPGSGPSEVSAATYIDWRERTRAFEASASSDIARFTLTNGNDAERVASVDVSPALFQLLGCRRSWARCSTDEMNIRAVNANWC